MAVLVNLHSAEEEKELLEFLDKKKYDYKATSDFVLLTPEQGDEIIRRDNAFAQGKTGARNWDDIVRELENVYR